MSESDRIKLALKMLIQKPTELSNPVLDKLKAELKKKLEGLGK